MLPLTCRTTLDRSAACRWRLLQASSAQSSLAYHRRTILLPRHSFLPRPFNRPQIPKSSRHFPSYHTISSTYAQNNSSGKNTMDAQEILHFLADSPPSCVRLEIAPHFEALNEQEKRYAHYLSTSAFVGARIVMRQTSPESESIFDFIISLHNSCNGDWKSLQTKAGISDDDLKYFLEYSAMFLGNCGNYKGHGDSKFIPRGSESSFAALATTSAQAESHYKATKDAIFSSNKTGLMQLGFPEDGHMTTYYPDSPNITKDEIAAVGDFMASKKLLPENTRLRKTRSGSFEVLIASAVTNVPAEGGDAGKETSFTIDNGLLAGKEVKLIYGDYSKEMAKISKLHKLAAENASNENQKKMQLAYSESFRTGSSLVFKESQRYWVKDKGPMVESNIGFIEKYRDPNGVRGEWEGFIAMVNLPRTKAFGTLVDNAETMIPKLPWSKEFEKDKFLSPDFTSLEVLSFASSGIPAGINIPNYDDIRQNEGFKNVSLGNVLSAKAPNEKIPFIKDKDLAIYSKYRDPAFEVQVGLHELLGHGTGKLLNETTPGSFNFNKNSPPINPLTQKPITHWYEPGQTWSSLFGSVAASYEECRAESVAMALLCDFDILKIFGFGDGTPDINGEAGDVLYAGYLLMARAGVASLEFWDPKSRKWGQAHAQARFSILQCFLAAGSDFCKLDYTKDDLSDLTISIDRSKITTLGRKAVEEYLLKLQVYKSTGDVEAGTKLYLQMTDVDPEFWGGKVREVVMKNKQPRKVFVQANTELQADGKVVLKEYDASLEGMIRSFAEKGI